MLVELKNLRGPNWTHYAVCDRFGRDTGRRRFVSRLGAPMFVQSPLGVWRLAGAGLRTRLQDLVDLWPVYVRRGMTLAQAGSMFAATLTLQPDAAAGKDTGLSEANNGTNYGTQVTVEVGNWAVGDTRNVLIEFTGLSSLPDDCHIVSATLTLYFDSASEHVFDADIFRLLLSWTEGGATWDSRNGADNWNTGGAEGSGTDRAASATQRITLVNGNDAIFNGLAPDVQMFVTRGAVNYGWVIEAAPGSLTSRWIKYDSSDSLTAADRPKIVVVYERAPRSSSVAFNNLAIY